MKEFFKYVFATVVGFFLSTVLIVIFLVVIVSAVISAAGDEKTVTVSANSVLHLNLNKPISERTPKSPFSDLPVFGLDNNTTLGLNDILASIKKAKKDGNIKGIYLDMSSVEAGMASLEEIRNALTDFKTSGKFILAYSEVYTQGAYYLASVADKVYLNPEGILEFKGFSSQIMFYKGLLDKLDIEMQVIKVGTYKSAVEPFITTKMSDANREQVTTFMNSLYGTFLKNIAATRKLDKDSLFAIANQLKIQQPSDALRYKLVDGLKYKDEVLDELRTKTGTEKDKTIPSITISDYSSTLSNSDKTSGTSKDKIAIVYASGEIIGGEGTDNTIGSERISRAIRKARTDSSVKAVVLRVNSPGGSALASDVIWREVVLTKKVKPVIASFGDYAASGGYYIACAADSIIAQPNTITGSIGVFGMIPNMQKLFNNKLGLTFDGVKTGQYADLGGINRPLTEAERLIIQKQVNHIYDSFTKHVSEGRKKTQAYVDSVGQGRVWAGNDALKLGLVDRLGNINDAIASAAKKANIKTYKVVEFPDRVDKWKSLLENSSDKIQMYFTKREMGDNYIYYQQMKKVTNTSGYLTRMPFDIKIN